MNNLTILFVTTNQWTSWGGSEVLWRDVAKICYEKGHNIYLSIKKWDRLPDEISSIFKTKVITWPNNEMSLAERFINKINPNFAYINYCNKLGNLKADYIFISLSYNFDNIKLLKIISKLNIKYYCIVQSANEAWWLSKEDIDFFQFFYSKAERVFFVSKANHLLTEKQIGKKIENTSIVFNSYDIKNDVDLNYPSVMDGIQSIACVARYELHQKALDVLFEVMADNKWRNRPLQINCYGKGINEYNLQLLLKYYDLKNVHLSGHQKPIDIWRNNQALVLPSRYEGMPLALIEAMLCGRLGIVTDVSGNPELIEDNVNGFIASAPKATYLDEAMERAWDRRNEWEQIGINAQKSIKTVLPKDPALDLLQKTDIPLTCG